MKKIEPITFEKATDVPKGWGKEVQIVNEVVEDQTSFPSGYSGKLLVYTKRNATSSLHFHIRKHETFYCLCGEFLINYFDLDIAQILTRKICAGDKVRIPPGNPHQIICLTNEGTIIEFASSDYTFDNYRIGKGDSQK